MAKLTLPASTYPRTRTAKC